MVEKLTPLATQLTRSGVPVYSVNSRSHTQVPDRVLITPDSFRVDVRILRVAGPKADFRTATAQGITPIPATFSRFAGTAQSLSMSRAMRGSSRKPSRDG